MKLKITEFLKKDFLDEIGDLGVVNSFYINREKYKVDREKFFKRFNFENVKNCCVVGTDLMKYSLKDIHVQVFLPFLLQDIHSLTIKRLIELESFIFNDFEEIDFPRIDTGDGGFTIFDNPLCGLIYTIYYQVNIDLYNTFHISPKIRDILGPLDIRYSMSYDKLIKFDENFYGSAIINSARINSKDKLCRFLIDQNTKEWFIEYFNGIENLSHLNEEEIRISLIDSHEFSTSSAYLHGKSIFTKQRDSHWGIKNCNLIDIGKIQSKDLQITIYSLHLQTLVALLNPNSQVKDINKEVKITSTLGNLSTVGLSD